MMTAVEGCSSSKGNKAQLGLEAAAPVLWGKEAAVVCSRWRLQAVVVSSMCKVLVGAVSCSSCLS